MKPITRIAAILLAVVTAGCAAFGGTQREGVSSSLVEYLYPDGSMPPPGDQVPNLKLPITVGLAFVPASTSRHNAWVAGDTAISAAVKAELLEQVRAAFRSREYIRDIRIIPETYLSLGRGFEHIEQLSRLYGFDVIALVSYDQIAASSERKSSLLYWTIVGAYIVKGTLNEVHTFVDTAILDVRTRKLLFRAPGIDVDSSHSTMVENGSERRAAREAGMRRATAQMIGNLDQELGAFRERVKEDHFVVITRAPGLVGAGPFVPFTLLVLLSLACARQRQFA